MPYFKNPYEEAEYEAATRIWAGPFGEVTMFEADLIEVWRENGHSDDEIAEFLKEI